MLAEFAEGALDGVALLVGGGVEAGRAAAGAAAPLMSQLAIARRGAKAWESWRCPELVTRARGRHPESASRCTLLVSPPRDRPSASRFL